MNLKNLELLDNPLMNFLDSSEQVSPQHRNEIELALMNEAGLIATQLLDLDQILEFSVDFMVNRIGMAVATLYLWDEEQARFTLRAYHGVDEAQKEEINRRRLAGFDLAQKVVGSGREIFIPNMATEQGFRGIWDDLENRSYVKMPLMSRGIIVGMFGLQTHGGQPMTERDVQFLKAIGRELGIAIDNSLLISDAQKREEQADTLFDIGTRISSSLSLRVVLDAIAEAARELIKTDIGLIGLVDDRSNEVLYQAGFGLSKTLSKKMRLKINDHPDWVLLLDHQPVIKNEVDFCTNCLHDPEFITDEEIKAGLTVPLFRAGSMIGLIEVFSRAPRKFSADDSQLLNRLSTQVVVAIENAQLYHQLRHLAVLEERDLIARNLHDHLAQGLGYIKVKASIAEDLLASGEIDDTSACLKELIRTTQSLYTDVREEIFNLRQEVAEFDNFFASMDEYLCEYKKYYDLDVDLIIERNCLCDLPPDVANQLLRVVQEAMTNIRRHANADFAHVTCSLESKYFQIAIEDNGQGFEPDKFTRDERQHFGLAIMEERVKSMGGVFKIESEPEQGTKIIVQVPSRLFQGRELF